MNLKNLSTDTLLGFVVPALAFVAIVGLVPLAILPQLDRIAAANKVIKEKEARLGRLDKKIDVLRTIDEDGLEEKLANAEIALPTGKSLAPLIEGIKRISSESTMILNSIKLKPGKIATSSAKKSVEGSPTPANLPQGGLNLPTSRFDLLFVVEMRGSFESFQKFLDLVEKTKRLLLVVGFSANSSTDGSNNNFSLIMNAPFRDIHKESSDLVAEDLPAETEDTKEIYQILGEEFVENTRPVPGESCQACLGVTNPFP